MRATSSKIRRVMVALVLGVLAITAAPPALAADSRQGYYECNPIRQIRLTSTTTTAGSGAIFSVGHQVLGGTQSSWSTAGCHASSHGTAGGQWAISTGSYSKWWPWLRGLITY